MANLIATADAGLTGGSTWATVDQGAGSQQTSHSASTSSTVSYVYCPAFTAGPGTTIDGVLLMVDRQSSVGTFSVALSDDGGTTATREVIVNTSDIPSGKTLMFFKFSSTLALDGGADYQVGVKSSSNATVLIHRSATTADWFHLLRQTATASAGAGDALYIAGEWTAAATVTARTVTMDSTATTDYGEINIGASGSLTYGTSAATNYVLRTSGVMTVWDEGTLNIGTTGTPIPRDSTAVLEFDCTTDGEFGLVIDEGAFNAQGLSRTSGKNVIACRLNTDEAVNSTTLGVDTDTGWLDNDAIAVASTTQTANQCEAGTLNGGAGASSLTVDGFAGAGGGLAFAHSGTSPTQAEVVLLTRNIMIRSTLSTAMAYVFFDTDATVDVDWVDFRYLGENTAGKRGVEIATSTGSCNIQFSCIRDCEDMGLVITGTTSNNITFSNNVLWNCALSTGPVILVNNATSGTNITISSNYLIKNGTSFGCNFADAGVTFTNNVIAGMAGSGFVVSEGNSTLGTFSGNISHSNGANGFTISSSMIRGTFLDCIAWRNVSAGFALPSPFQGTIDGCISFGNAGGGLDILDQGSYINLVDCEFYSEASFDQPQGIEISVGGSNIVVVDNCDFSQTGLAHSGADIVIGATDATATLQMILRNCRLGATTELNGQSGLYPNFGFVSSDTHDGTNRSFKVWLTYGTLSSDSSIFNSESPSLRLTPGSSLEKLESASLGKGMKAIVANGESIDISVSTRKSSSGDGAEYNGNQPRLILKTNPAIGIDADVVIDTHSAAFGSWEVLTGTTPTATDDGVMEFVVDCDGTVGWVNVTEWSAA